MALNNRVPRGIPSYQTYTNGDALLNRVATTAGYGRITPDMTTLGVDGTTVVKKRSDPFGIFQLQSAAPSVYPASAHNFSNVNGSQGFTICQDSSSFIGGCASCMCQTPANSALNSRYGNDSFVVGCIQGEVWGSQLEGQTGATYAVSAAANTGGSGTAAAAAVIRPDHWVLSTNAQIGGHPQSIPSYQNYATNSATTFWTGVQSTLGYVRQGFPPSTLPNLPVAELRSDPLGIYQSQDFTPLGYPGFYSDMEGFDISGRNTFCQFSSATGGFSGSCASCLCQTPAGAIPNRRYGNSSFVVKCIQGEEWGSAIETPGTSSENSNWFSKIKKNIFFGSSAYERTNFVTASFCIMDSEMAGIPFGAKTLRVGVGLPYLWQTASYFEEGGGKYVNFYTQLHRAGLLYQASSPQLNIQGTTKSGVVSLSTAAKPETGGKAMELLSMLLFFLPPIFRKKSSYVHKKRRAEITLACATVNMRVGHFEEEIAVEALKNKLTKLSNARASVKYPYHWSPGAIRNNLKYIFGSAPYVIRTPHRKYIQWFYARKGRIEGLERKIQAAESNIKKSFPSFTLIGKGKNKDDCSSIHLGVPQQELDHPQGGSSLGIFADHLYLGGLKKGPDIFTDTKKQKIRMVVGPNDSKFSLIDMSSNENLWAGIRIKIAKDSDPLPEGSGKMDSVLTKDLSSRLSEVWVNHKSVEFTHQSAPGQKHFIDLYKKGFEFSSEQKITITSTKKISFKASSGKIQIKGSSVTANGQSLLAN